LSVLSEICCVVINYGKPIQPRPKNTFTALKFQVSILQGLTMNFWGRLEWKGSHPVQSLLLYQVTPVKSTPGPK